MNISGLHRLVRNTTLALRKTTPVARYISLALSIAFSATSIAHTALMSCYDEGNGYILCEGGFSDGASAEGVEFRIEHNGAVVMQTKLDEYGEVYFQKPLGRFTVVLNGGEGHVVHIDGRDISE